MPAMLSGFSKLSGFSIRKSLAFLSLFCLASCYKDHLYVQEEWIDDTYMASYHVDTPDPLRDNPPEGEKLLIAWDFPKSLFLQNLTLQARVRLWDNSEQTYSLPVERKRDTADLFFPSPNKILTYQIEVINEEGKVVEVWNHQFWTRLIEVDE